MSEDGDNVDSPPMGESPIWS